MALGFLMILFVALTITAIVVQILLYTINLESKYNYFIFIVNMLLGVLLSVLAFTAFPSNFTGLKILAAIWGILAVLAMIMMLTRKQFIMISKLLLTISIIGSLIQMFL